MTEVGLETKNSLDTLDFEKLLQSSDGKGRVIPPKSYSVPKEYDFNIIPGEEAVVTKAISVFKRYLELPIIWDEFETHEERRNWRDKTSDKIRASGNGKGSDAIALARDNAKKFDQFMRETKMKRNRITAVLGFADLLQQVGAITPELADKLLVAGGKTLPRRLTEEQAEDLIKSITDWEIKEIKEDEMAKKLLEKYRAESWDTPPSREVIDGLIEAIKENVPEKRMLTEYDPMEGKTTQGKVAMIDDISDGVVAILRHLGKK